MANPPLLWLNMNIATVYYNCLFIFKNPLKLSTKPAKSKIKVDITIAITIKLIFSIDITIRAIETLIEGTENFQAPIKSSGE